MEYKQRFLELLPEFADGWLSDIALDQQCESPIECLMLAALYLYGALHHGGSIAIASQENIGDYRVDFVVSRFNRLKSVSVIVECDGHDFHEKTKAQASRDKKRDRELQRLGFNVLRFTGSDIWKDLFGCAQEVFGFLDEKMFSE